MRVAPLLVASAATVALAGCGKAPAPRATLDCPASRGDLTRTSISPDGKSCAYTSSDGAEVTLQLVSAQGGVDATLSGIETTLLAGRQKPAETADGDKAAVADKNAAKADKDAAAADKDAAKAAKEAQADAKGGGVQIHAKVDDKDVDAANVEVKGGKVAVSESHDGQTHVNLPGIHITADDKNDSAHVQVGPININAGDGTATIRVKRDVRLRGEALSPEKHGFRATFIYHGDDLPDGYRFVGYEAGGPKAGPFAIAIVKSKTKDADGGEIQSDITKLVRLNGGV